MMELRRPLRPDQVVYLCARREGPEHHALSAAQRRCLTRSSASVNPERRHFVEGRPRGEVTAGFTTGGLPTGGLPPTFALGHGPRCRLEEPEQGAHLGS